MLSVYNRLPENNVTIRDYESMKKYIKLIQWGRENPVQFIEEILQIPLMDYQKWLIANTWKSEYAVWVCSRNSGKSFLANVLIQARAILFPKLQVHILSAVSRQSMETFTTGENIAKNNVKSLIRSNTVILDEIEKTKSDSDGFTHDQKKGYVFKLMNGSSVTAVVGGVKTIVGKRSNMLVYDESGIIPKELFDLSEPFATQSSSFKVGASFDSEVYPQEIPNLRLYIGSATDTNSYFYNKYKEGCKQMLSGNDKYFVADLNCEIPLHPTMNGKPMPALLTQDEINRKMRENEIMGMREYYNIFDHFDIEDAVVTRSDIFANTEVFVPYLHKKSKYIISYDPASKNDNAPVLIMELFKDEETKEWCGRCVHMENLVVTYNDGSKRPMRLDEQVKRLRELIYEFNGKEKTPPYEHVKVLIDSGSGGQAPSICQELCKDWVDNNGHKHPGLYDENNEHMKRWAEAFPHAVSGSLFIVEPRKYRNALFEAGKALVPLGVVKFAPSCPKNDILVLDDGTNYKLEKKKLNSLIQMDLMKEEVASMVRIKSPNGGVTYQLPVEKRNKMHDDRAYVFYLAVWWLYQIRTDEILGEQTSIDYSVFFSDKPKITSENEPWLSGLHHSSQTPAKKTSPFKGKSPFSK